MTGAIDRDVLVPLTLILDAKAWRDERQAISDREVNGVCRPDEWHESDDAGTAIASALADYFPDDN